MSVGSNLEVERALSPTERRKLLDAADLLTSVSGRSKDRRRNKNTDPIARSAGKNGRPWRNRAIIYTLIETGMRRAVIVNLNVDGIDWEGSLIAVAEKGDITHSYPISDQGLAAIKEYLANEHYLDGGDHATALFLPAVSTHNSNGRLTISPDRPEGLCCLSSAMPTSQDIWSEFRY